MSELKAGTNLESVVKAEVIELEDEFLAKNVLAFKESVTDAIERGRRLIVVDCHACKNVDSASLESLLWAIEEIQDRGGLMKIACLNDTMKRVFEITQFDRIFEIYDDVLYAVRAFA